MNVIPTSLAGVLILEPQVFGDARGFFMESYNERVFNEAVGHRVRFVQDNHSQSSVGVLRGLHYQLPPHAQGKLVRVTAGRVYDVAVDVRRSSPDFGKWVGVEISAENHRQLWIPPGFAHGFLVLSATADLLYKTTNYYCAEADVGVRWNDPALGIAWPRNDLRIMLSQKDMNAPLLDECAIFETARQPE